MKTILIKKNAEAFMLEKVAANVSIYSLYCYKSIMKDFTAFLEARNVKTTIGLNKRLLDEYSASLVKSNLTGKTIQNRAKFINQFMRYCGKQNLKMQKPKFNETRKPALTMQEINLIIKFTAFNRPISVLCYFLLATGARSRTARNIKVQDVDFGTGYIYFTVTKTRKIIKIPICENLDKLLRRYIHYYDLKKDDYLFFNVNKKPFSKSAIYRRIQEYLAAIGIENKGVHIFRHTFAKACVLNGCDTITLAELMGHSNIKQSQEYVLFYSMELREKGAQVNPVQNLNYLKYATV